MKGSNARRFGLLMSCLAAAACDGALHIEGQVYEWLDAGPTGQSFAMVDLLARPLPARLTPVVGAEVLMEPWTPAERARNEDAQLWTSRAATDGTGQFRVGGVVKPGWFDATLSVRCDGFAPLEHVFRHDRFKHRAIVVLVRER